MTNSNEKYVDYLELPTSVWKRPEGPLRVWRVFDGRKKMENGKIPKFTIQEVPEELKEELMDFMEKYFLTEETTCVSQNLAGDPVAVREFRTVWKDLLNQGISIAAFATYGDPNEKPVMAGVNVLHVSMVDEETSDTTEKQMAQHRSEKAKKIVYMVSKLGSEFNIREKYDIDMYLHAWGLSVSPAFRGQGLGEELLRARDDIGRAYQISVSETLFTGTASQILASRVGFETLLEKNYSELLDQHGNVLFPGVPVKSLKVMTKKLY